MRVVAFNKTVKKNGGIFCTHPRVYGNLLLNYRVTQLFHAIYSSGSSTRAFSRDANIQFSINLPLHHFACEWLDHAARRVRHQAVWQTRRVVLQPINSAFRCTKTRTERDTKMPIKAPATFAARVYADTPWYNSCTELREPRSSRWATPCTRRIFLGNLGGLVCFPKGNSFRRWTLARHPCASSVYTESAIQKPGHSFPRPSSQSLILSRVNSRHAKVDRDWINARISARVPLLDREYVFLGYSIFGKHSRPYKIGRDLQRGWFIALDPSVGLR